MTNDRDDRVTKWVEETTRLIALNHLEHLEADKANLTSEEFFRKRLRQSAVRLLQIIDLGAPCELVVAEIRLLIDRCEQLHGKEKMERSCESVEQRRGAWKGGGEADLARI